MRNPFTTSLVLLFATSLVRGQSLDPESRIDLGAERVPAELMLRLTDDASSPALLEQIAAEVGAVKVWSPWPGMIHAFAIADDAEMAAALRTLNADPRVRYAEPNYIAHALDTFPNDPNFGNQWGWHNGNDADIDAPAAWDIATDASQVLVAIIDTGILYTHSDLAANVWTNPGEIPSNGIDDDGNGFVDDVHGYDFINGDGNPTDDNGHGTHTAGTVGAHTNNGVGVAGACWNATIAGVKFLGSGGSGSYDDAVSSVYYCVTIGAKVSNNSWAGGSYSQSLYDSIDTAGDNGHLFVAAAGNSGQNSDTSPQYPAAFDLPEILSVAATDSSDNKASFSNYGAVSVDLGAPGVDIQSTWNNGSYNTISGTSMATPHVAGVATMVFAVSGTDDPLQVKQIILDSVDPNASLAGITVTGGRLNYHSALASIKPIGFVLPNGAPSTLHHVGGDVIRLEVVPATGAPVDGTGLFHVDFGEGVLDLEMSAVSPNVYDATVPGLAGTECGEFVSFWFSAEADDGQRYQSSVHTAQSYGDVAVIEDLDFETAPGWSVDNVNLADGPWDRGVPVGGGDRQDPPTDFDGSGQCWLTDNVDGNSDVDGGPTRLLSPIYDLTGIGSVVEVSYARWFQVSPPDEDRLTVELSSDGGANWVLGESVSSSGNWEEATLSVTDFVPLTSNFRMRFSAVDDPNDTVTEAGLDAFQIRAVDCPMALAVTPPVVDLGDTVTLTTWKGKTGAPCLRYVTSFGGVPTLIPLPIGLFDLNGDAKLSGSLPNDPGLHGVAIEFFSLGIDRDGKIVATNVARLDVR